MSEFQGIICWVCLPALAAIWLLKISRNKLRHIPGPPGLPVLGNMLQLRTLSAVHQILTRWHKEFGPVYKIKLLNSPPFIMVSGYDALHEALVQKGQATGGRCYEYFRMEYIGGRRGITMAYEPNATWRTLRKLVQRHLKQFGDGMSRLEVLIEEVGNELFQEFETTAGTPYDPKLAIKSTTAKNIAFLVTGEKPEDGDPLLDLIQRYESGFIRFVPPITRPSIMIYDWCPWLRYLNLKTWREIRGVNEVSKEIWESVKHTALSRPENESLARLLLSHCATRTGSKNTSGERGDPDFLDERDAEKTCVNLLLAGIMTTTSTFYSFINILAHNKPIQDVIWNEIIQATSGEKVELKHRYKMPFTRACIYEALRYTSIVPLGVSHRATEDVEICGYLIPRGSHIKPNLWALHHDPEFWIDPEIFRPERFLSDAGELVSADHPHRKHLLPFGAGTRVCLGESMALARLFVWTVTMIQRFTITPAYGNAASLVAAENYRFSGMMSSDPYEVIFTPRL